MRNKSIEYSPVGNSYKEFSNEIANKVVERLRKCRENKGTDRKKLKILCETQEFPTAYNSIVNYEQKVYGTNQRQSIKGMRLATFYEICEYYNVSADYLLGFKESRHRESSADYVSSEFGFDDNILEIFRKMKYHTDIKLGYKKFSEMEFISFILTKFFFKIESEINNYFNKEDELEEFINTNIDKEINMFKNAESLTAENETHLQSEYGNVKYGFEQARYKLIKALDVFLQDLKKELKNPDN